MKGQLFAKRLFCWGGWGNGIIGDRKRESIRVKYVKEVCMLRWGLYHFRGALHIRCYFQHHSLRNFLLYIKILLYMLPRGLISNKKKRKECDSTCA